MSDVEWTQCSACGWTGAREALDADERCPVCEETVESADR